MPESETSGRGIYDFQAPLLRGAKAWLEGLYKVSADVHLLLLDTIHLMGTMGIILGIEHLSGL